MMTKLFCSEHNLYFYTCCPECYREVDIIRFLYLHCHISEREARERLDKISERIK